VGQTSDGSRETAPTERAALRGRDATPKPGLARRVLDEIYEFVAVLSPDGTTLDINRSALEAVGATAEEVLGKPFWEAPWWTVSAGLQERLRGLIAEAAQGAFVRTEVVHYGGGGRELITVDLSIKPVRGPDGRVVFLIPEGRDVTERKRVEAEVARKNDEIRHLYERLREYDELKTQFFANVSHELRTPLTLILGPLERWVATPDLPPGLREALTMAQGNARILLRLVNDLLDIARLDANKMSVTYQRSDLARLSREIAANFDAIAQEHGVSFSVTTPDELPASIDLDKIQRVLLNLLSNAFKFTPRGGSVRLALRAVADRAVLALADSGPGVPPELRERIFERFFQVEGGATRRFGGAGLGLGIAREFVLAHRGTIEVDSAPELGGARFRVELPLEAPAGAEVTKELLTAPGLPSPADQVVAELERGAAEARPAARHGHGARILVVEDNPDMSRFLAEALGAEWDVECAADGQEGLEAALRLEPDLIVTDMMMPRLSGDELLRELRRHPETEATPVVVLTAKADDESRVRLLRDGAQDYVMKPFNTDELSARVATWLRVSHARKLLQSSLTSSEHDVSRLAAELIERKDEAEKVSEAKTAFLNLVSHELRTPLSNILLQLKLMEMAGVPEGLQTPVQRLDRATQRLQGLFEGLLQYVRLKSGASPTEAEPTDLARLAGDVVEDMQPQAMQKGLVLELEPPPPLPPCSGREEPVRVILANLIGNAIKYPEQGRTQVSLQHGRDGSRMRVRDPGPGAPAEQVGAIFEPFVQLEPIQRKHHAGVGLGLTLVRDMVSSLGGRTEVQSELGRGSTFTVVFPECKGMA